MTTVSTRKLKDQLSSYVSDELIVVLRDGRSPRWWDSTMFEAKTSGPNCWHCKPSGSSRGPPRKAVWTLGSHSYPTGAVQLPRWSSKTYDDLPSPTRSALMLVEREIDVTFVSSDFRQLEAAAAEGIVTLDPAVLR